MKFSEKVSIHFSRQISITNSIIRFLWKKDRLLTLIGTYLNHIILIKQRKIKFYTLSANPVLR